MLRAMLRLFALVLYCAVFRTPGVTVIDINIYFIEISQKIIYNRIIVGYYFY